MSTFMSAKEVLDLRKQKHLEAQTQEYNTLSKEVEEALAILANPDHRDPWIEVSAESISFEVINRLATQLIELGYKVLLRDDVLVIETL